MKKLSLILLSLLSVVSPSISQKAPVKFGKIDASEIAITPEEKQSGAEAIVLIDYGETHFLYIQSTGWQMTFDRITRIKILNKDGFKWADIAIPYFHNSNGRENVGSLKGFTYNLSGGKLEKSKLENGSIFKEELNEYWDAEKFSMPDVKEGSVIEYTYQVKSEFFSNLRDWEFQWEIPVKWSEYIVGIPEYFNYQALMLGYLPLTEKTNDDKIVTVTLHSSERQTQGYAVTTQMSTDRIQYQDRVTRYVIKNAPALKEEAFVTSTDNYKAKIIHELNFIKFPNARPINYLENWTSFNKTFMEDDDFGKVPGKTGFAKDLLEPISQQSNPEEKVAAVFDLVRSKMKWDGRQRKYASNLKDAFEKGTGSSSEINLMLTGFLQKVGVIADPVLISTRDNGYVREQFAIADQFNYVICRAQIGDKVILLDATDNSLPLGVLPFRCLNGKGRVISDRNPGWVDLMESPGSSQSLTATLKIGEDGSASGNFQREYTGYQAFSAVKTYREVGEESYLGKIKERHNGWEIGDITVDFTEPTKIVKENYSVSASEVGLASNDLIYINPIIAERTEKNPFISDSRKYPVEFGYPRSERLVINIEIPEGYKVEEIPESVNVGVKNSAAFGYKVSASGQAVQVESIITIGAPSISAIDYNALKNMFDIIVAKQAEQIVLKKSE